MMMETGDDAPQPKISSFDPSRVTISGIFHSFFAAHFQLKHNFLETLIFSAQRCQ